MSDKINKESFDFSDDEDEQITTIPPIRPISEKSLTFWGASDSDPDDVPTEFPNILENISELEDSIIISSIKSKSSSTKGLSSKLSSVIGKFKGNDKPTQFSTPNSSKLSDFPNFERPPKNTSVTDLPVDLGLIDNEDDEITLDHGISTAGRKSLFSFSKKKLNPARWSKSRTKTPPETSSEASNQYAPSSKKKFEPTKASKPETIVESINENPSSEIPPPPPHYFSSNQHVATKNAKPEVTKPLPPPPPKLNSSPESPDSAYVELENKATATNSLTIIPAKPSSSSSSSSLSSSSSAAAAVYQHSGVVYHDIFDSTDEDISSEEDSPLAVLQKAKAKAKAKAQAKAEGQTKAEAQAQAKAEAEAEAQAQTAAQAQESFHIVLVNIKIAAMERHIHCERKPLDGQSTPPYVALSYRWGELDEHIVPATNDYNARISSFHLSDFFKLCRALMHEPDLQHIAYVWVDAICVNQDHVEKRKETIYRMNDIYIHATTIVAVPDLHAHHLSISSTANHETMTIIKKYRRYLYYLLLGTSDAQHTLIKMDHAWMDAMGVPAMDVHRRDVIMAATTQQQQQQPSGSPFIQDMMTLMLHPNPTPFTTTRSIPDNDSHAARAEHYQQLPYRMMVEFQRLEWQQKLDQRKTDIIKCMDFFQSIMEDWSNRTWVISEYHIAKRKTGKLKFWYNQLTCPELIGQRFFEFDFTQQQQQQQQASSSLEDDNDNNTNTPAAAAADANNKDSQQQQQPFTSQIIYLTRTFKGSMRRRLTKRTVLEMMLQTKASKHEDRFHSIIPLAPKYKHHITDRHSISRLGISDMLSVRLQLMAWMDTKDRLILLFCTRHPLASRLPLLPTFASHFKAIQPNLMTYLSTTTNDITTKNSRRSLVEWNFDLNAGSKDVRLVRGHPEGQQQWDTLWLCPRVYYLRRAVHPTGQYHRHRRRMAERSFYQEMGGKDHPLWLALGLDPARDPLDAVSIPLFCPTNNNNNDLGRGLKSSDLQIVGSWEKNIWLVYPFCSNYKDGRIFPSQMCTMKDTTRLPNGFRIF